MINRIKALFVKTSEDEQMELDFFDEPDVMMSTKNYQLAQDWAYVKGVGVGVAVTGAIFAALIWLLPYI